MSVYFKRVLDCIVSRGLPRVPADPGGLIRRRVDYYRRTILAAEAEYGPLPAAVREFFLDPGLVAHTLPIAGCGIGPHVVEEKYLPVLYWDEEEDFCVPLDAGDDPPVVRFVAGLLERPETVGSTFSEFIYAGLTKCFPEQP